MLNDEPNPIETALKAILEPLAESFQSDIRQLHAKCLALEATLLALAKETGADAGKLAEYRQRAENQFLHELFQQVRTRRGPAKAASLDTRPLSIGDDLLPDGKLLKFDPPAPDAEPPPPSPA